jgi:hypothetical protein
MVDTNLQLRDISESVAAELAAAAYQIALRHGIRDSFLDVELDLWRRLRTMLAPAILAGDGVSPSLTAREQST